MEDFLNLDDHIPIREVKTQGQKRKTNISDKTFHFVGDVESRKPLTVKSKTPNQRDVERYNTNKNTQIIADEYMDIDAQIQMIDAREDLEAEEKNQMK